MDIYFDGDDAVCATQCDAAFFGEQKRFHAERPPPPVHSKGEWTEPRGVSATVLNVQQAEQWFVHCAN